MAPLLQELIVATRERLRPFYAGTPHITLKEIEAHDPDDHSKREHAYYPMELLSDVAELVTGHWGYVLGRVEPKQVKSSV